MLDASAARKLALAVALFAALIGFSLLPWPGAASSQDSARATAASPNVEVVITSAGLTQALTRMPDLLFSSAAPASPIIHVSGAARYQRITGFGGAMTDSSAWLIRERLGPGTRDALMNALFGATGIHLNLLRVPMGASDFTSGRKPYSYDDMPPGKTDPKLRQFSIRHDTSFIVPALAQALSINPGLFVLANPWSPPGWMKSNDAMGNPDDTAYLKPSALRSLAAYFVRFLQAYSMLGIHVTAITPQNEPGQASIYPGMNLSEPSEAAFVRDDLVPALKAAKLDTKIYGYDWGWSAPQIRYAHSLVRSAAARELTGISTHCYRGNPTTISALHAEAPRLDEIIGECSPGIMPASTSEVEIGSMRNWASALALWNLALDRTGGPVQPPNHACPKCTGIVTVEESTQTVRFTRDYYQLGQISKFVLPGAVRIGSNHFVSYVHPSKHRSMATPGLDDVAFENPDGSRVLVAYNGSSTSITFGVEDGGQYFSSTLAPRATGTFIWNQAA
ncbi:MAG: glucosylceramidase [Actinomycetota bacterium]|nr:glucosylceramidase [Actinomycetota bacterium]